MATYTSYLNLEKPAVGETFNLLKINQNWDKIDQGVSSLNSKTTEEFSSPHTIDSTYNKLTKRNGVVSFILRITLSSDTSAFAIVATIPSGFRPDTQQVYYSVDAGTYDVTSGGNVRIAAPQTSGKILMLTGTYVAA